MPVRAVALLAAVLVGLVSAPALAAPTEVVVDAEAVTTPVPASLQGYAFDPRTASPRMRPPTATTYRLDAGFQDLYDCRTGHLNPSKVRAFEQQLDVIDAAGAEPIVILDYMPACLAATLPGDARDPKLLPPRDPAVWQRVVTELVEAIGPGRAGSGRRPVRYLEAWNEPDALFWQGTLADYVSGILLPAGTAVTRVAAAGHLPLKFSVAATTFPDPAWQDPLLRAAKAHGIPVGFVSWHYYGNYPLLGPDGGEPGENPALALAAGHPNPAADPLTFGAGVQLMRETAQEALGTVPELVLDEWNLSAGGFDKRNDTYVGAAFQAATLVELAAAGLPRALLYASVDVHSTDQSGAPLPVRHGDWGVVDRAGGRKPAWYAQRLFAQLRGRRIAVDPHPDADTWLAATREGRTLHLLAVAFSAHGDLGTHSMTLALKALRPGRHRLHLTRIDATHGGDRPEPPRWVVVDRSGAATLSLDLPANAVVAVTVA